MQKNLKVEEEGRPPQGEEGGNKSIQEPGAPKNNPAPNIIF